MTQERLKGPPDTFVAPDTSTAGRMLVQILDAIAEFDLTLQPHIEYRASIPAGQPPGVGKGRPSALSLYRSVLLTLLLVRQNLSQTTTGDMFGNSQPTVSRIFRRYLPLIEQALCLHTPPLPQALRGRVVVVDGPLIPTGNRTQPGHKRSQYRGHPNYSGKRRAQGLTVQVLAGIDGTLLTVSAGLPGSTHDSNAYQLTVWPTCSPTSPSSATWAIKAPRHPVPP